MPRRRWSPPKIPQELVFEGLALVDVAVALAHEPGQALDARRRREDVAAALDVDVADLAPRQAVGEREGDDAAGRGPGDHVEVRATERPSRKRPSSSASTAAGRMPQMPPPSMERIRKGRSLGHGRGCLRSCWVPSERRGERSSSSGLLGGRRFGVPAAPGPPSGRAPALVATEPVEGPGMVVSAISRNGVHSPVSWSNRHRTGSPARST